MNAEALVSWLIAAPTLPSVTSLVSTSTGTTAVQVWTLVVAGLAVVATVGAAVLLRQTGKGQVKAAKTAAEASERSAQAAEKSAEAAQASVGVNRETAMGVAVRAEADALAKRYQDAASQLGHEKAAVRLAGVYAMARLADDWSDQRQECVDVLCAYLRMPWPQIVVRDKIETDEGDREVRASIVRTISAHLRIERANNWFSLNLDLSRSTLPLLDLDGATFLTKPSFFAVRVLGLASARDATFHFGANFAESRFEQGLFMNNISVLNSWMILMGTTYPKNSGSVVAPKHLGIEAAVMLSNAEVLGHLEVYTQPSESEQGCIAIDGVKVREEATFFVETSIGRRDDDSEHPYRPSFVARGYVGVFPSATAELPSEFTQIGVDNEGAEMWSNFAAL
jgi:hypothetical protein